MSIAVGFGKVYISWNHYRLYPWVWKSFDQRWSPRGRPWPRGRPRGHILKSLALALASKVKSLALALASKPQVLENCPVLGSRTALFFKQLKFCWKAPETSRKICEHFFCFPHLEHRRSQGRMAGGPPPSQLKFHQGQKCDKKSYSSFSFSFFLAFFVYNSITITTILKARGAGSPSILFLPANLNVQPEKNGEFLS